MTIGSKPGARKLFRDDGSMGILPDLQGQDRIDQRNPNYAPFYFGDVNPNGTFIHIFDVDDITSIFSELDTAPDFLQYLSDRETLIQNKRISNVPRETNLLAEYLSNIDKETGRFHFPSKLIDGSGGFDESRLSGDRYRYLKRTSVYHDNKKYLSTSYPWDELIRLFTKSLLDGTSVGYRGKVLATSDAEYGLRHMAKESRFSRVYLSKALVTTFEKAEISGKPKFSRIVMPMEKSSEQGTVYIFLILAYPSDMLLPGGYKQYRLARGNMLLAYCDVILYLHRNLKRAIGIAFDASPKITGRAGGSEDLAFVEATEWTKKRIAQVQRNRSFYGIMDPGTVEKVDFSVEPPPPTIRKVSRQRRRALERKEKKERPKRGRC